MLHQAAYLCDLVLWHSGAGSQQFKQLNQNIIGLGCPGQWILQCSEDVVHLSKSKLELIHASPR